MTPISSCPDTLVARARSGGLSTAEVTQLRHHLSRCEACRVSYMVGRDFDAELAARPEDRQVVTSVVDAVCSSLFAESQLMESRRGSVFTKRRAVLLAPAVVMVAATAMAWTARPLWYHGRESRDRSSSSASARSSVAIPRAGAPAAEAIPAGPEPNSSSHIASMAIAMSGTGSPRGSSTSNGIDTTRARTARRIRSQPAGHHEDTRTDPASGGTDDNPANAVTARKLFAEANLRRRSGDDVRARQQYEELQRLFPISAEAQMSRVALGRLLLTRGQAADALKQFDCYLAQDTGKGLAEEALFGRATALQQLGRHNEESKTWTTLVDRYPGSIYADGARARLGKPQ